MILAVCKRQPSPRLCSKFFIFDSCLVPDRSVRKLAFGGFVTLFIAGVRLVGLNVKQNESFLFCTCEKKRWQAVQFVVGMISSFYCSFFLAVKQEQNWMKEGKVWTIINDVVHFCRSCLSNRPNRSFFNIIFGSSWIEETAAVAEVGLIWEREWKACSGPGKVFVVFFTSAGTRL